MHATLRVILNAAVDDGLIVENPTDKLGRALKLVAKTRVRQEHVKAFDRAQRDPFLTTAAKIEPLVGADVGRAGALRAPTR
jgi:hypothetical protein